MKLTTHKLTYAIVAATALLLLCRDASHAAPMLCSGEHETCLANCAKLTDHTLQRTCITVCGQRLAACRNTGCWNNGTTTYCGLLRR